MVRSIKFPLDFDSKLGKIIQRDVVRIDGNDKLLQRRPFTWYLAVKYLANIKKPILDDILVIFFQFLYNRFLGNFVSKRKISFYRSIIFPFNSVPLFRVEIFCIRERNRMATNFFEISTFPMH